MQQSLNYFKMVRPIGFEPTRNVIPLLSQSSAAARITPRTHDAADSRTAAIMMKVATLQLRLSHLYPATTLRLFLVSYFFGIRTRSHPLKG